MSLALATKGIIAQYVNPGGGYPVYTPMDEPDMDTERLGDRSMFPTTLEAKTRSKELEPSIQAKELKPKMKAE